jgi:SAM-dependent methyltransferase
MTAPTHDVGADRALKDKHRAMWALGDYPAVAADLVGPLGPRVVDAARVGPSDRVLDIAAGTGNAAIAAAARGATVVAGDLTPELLATGRSLAEARGLTLTWDVADAEALPYPDDSFDVVVSAIGIMFAPHHQAAADEALRVCRPGGRLAFAGWTPEGFIGRLFATMRPYTPPPPPGVQPPPLWGDEAHVRALLGARVTDLEFRREQLRVDHFDRPADFRDYFKSRYGPTIAAYRNIGADADRVAALDRDLAELARTSDLEPGRTVLDWEYLLVTARKAAP